ncbi:uncharacterized protein HMPREF1541_04291 [Cyphellophora europaea CBS 101466]|uniref:NAD-dependent epimerase/dehydratase domain-containing protein n=1 Tax=Cyphellophora europaea (strain CBS 101466) TaxID=1220924 RepID=W2RU38_CYPE1|nr:uncharacterized protein HMPREF1541_04291 [Cyphellophora europaea CBS 101466]ETN40016.1 hypothetical protein HMPREF1541_04291 [Cyphellophora europaea CBS 101466]
MSRGLVLLTGGSGFIGFAVLVEALSKGYNVRAVVRSQEKAKAITAANELQPFLPSLSFIIVPNFLAPGAFDKALEDVEYVIHVAAGLPAPDIDYTDGAQVHRRLIEPNCIALQLFLDAAKAQPSIKRVVLTSSAGALVPQLWDTTDNPSHPTPLPIASFTPNTPPPHRPLTGPFSCTNDAYHVTKALALQLTLSFLATHRQTLHFPIINILPSFTLGPHPLATSASAYLHTTNFFILAPLLGIDLPHPHITPAAICHVADVARVHVAALDDAIVQVANGTHRNFGVSNDVSEEVAFEDAKEIVRRRFPEMVVGGEGGEAVFSCRGRAETVRLPFEAGETVRVFGGGLRGFEDCVVDVVRGFLELRGGREMEV